MEDIFGFIGTLANYKKNPKPASIILTIISAVLMFYFILSFASDYKFIMNGKDALNLSVEKFDCVTPSKSYRKKCYLNVYFQTPQSISYNVRTRDRYTSSSYYSVLYLPSNPNEIVIDMLPFPILVFIFILSIVLFIMSRIVRRSTENYDYMREKLQKIGKKYKTQFLKIEHSVKTIQDYNTETKSGLRDKKQCLIDKNENKKTGFKMEVYTIITELRIKGENSVLEFRSEPIREYDPKLDVENFLSSGNRIGVWVNRKNPNEYYMDISFLNV